MFVYLDNLIHGCFSLKYTENGNFEVVTYFKGP